MPAVPDPMHPDPRPPTAAVALGTLYAAAAGLLWGLVFIAPTLLPQYPAALLSVGRYLAFGLIALPLAWLDRARLSELSRADWIEALKFAAIGNLLYYLLLAAAIQRAGGPLPTMIIGTLPVVIALAAQRTRQHHEATLPASRLWPSLLLLGAGIACVNHAEWTRLGPDDELGRYAVGAVLAAGAVACWTWYPLRNARWLRGHPDRHPRTWATAQGVATLPLAAVGALMLGVWDLSLDGALQAPLGPDPLRFVALMLVIGLFASWLGTLCWNEASQRLPPTLSGQLIVFETLAAMAYAFALRGQWPAPAVWLGMALLLAGVAWALRPTPSGP